MTLHEIQTEANALAKSLETMAKRSRSIGTPASDDDLSESIDNALGDAEKIARESQKSSRLGVVGAFSAGKTRLIETLLGCAGRFGKLVDEKPTSGNIVEFALEVGKAAETEFEEWKVEFMSETGGAGRILKRLFLEARNEQNRERSAKLDRLLDEAEFDEGQRPRWIKVQEWAMAAHAEARGGQLKIIAFEVYRLAYTVNHAPDWLDRTFELPEQADAFTLMTLSPDRSHYNRPLAEWNQKFPSVPSDTKLSGIPAELLRALFPIVRKIHVKVKVPSFVAESFGNKNHIDMRLVDCPGADADETNIRDAVICAFELSDIDAVLVLINGQRPGQSRTFLDGLLRIWGSRAKDRILAVVSRFDLLPFKSPKELETLAASSGVLTLEETLAAISNFETIYKAAFQTVIDRDPQRVCMVSTLGHLTVQLMHEGGEMRRGTPTFYADELRYQPETQDPTKLEATLRNMTSLPWLANMALWGTVGDRLALAGDLESQALSAILRDYRSDGGFKRLHDLLRTHLGQFGPGLLADRLELQLDDIKKFAKNAEATLNAMPKPKVAEVEVAKPELTRPDAVRELFRCLEPFVSNVDRTTTEFALERISKKGKLEPVAPPIRRWLVAEIYRWEHWKLLFNRIKRTGGLVELVDPQDPMLIARPGDLRDEQRTPVKSDDFLPSFRKTLEETKDVLFERCKDALRYHAEVLKQTLYGQIGASRLSEMKRVLDEPIRQVLNPIHESIGSDWLEGAVQQLVSKTQDEKPFDRFFPLQHGSEKAGEPLKALYYSWHKPLFDQYHNQFDDRHRHLMYVIKLRQVIVEAALTWLDRHCQVIEDAMKARIKNQVKGLRTIVETEVQKIPVIQGPRRRGPAA